MTSAWRVSSFDQSITLIDLGVCSMAINEKTSSKVASIASKGLKNPKSLSPKEIKSIAGAALTQTPDKPRKK